MFKIYLIFFKKNLNQMYLIFLEKYLKQIFMNNLLLVLLF
jgi:hypothetical protein